MWNCASNCVNFAVLAVSEGPAVIIAMPRHVLDVASSNDANVDWDDVDLAPAWRLALAGLHRHREKAYVPGTSYPRFPQRIGLQHHAVAALQSSANGPNFHCTESAPAFYLPCRLPSPREARLGRVQSVRLPLPHSVQNRCLVPRHGLQIVPGVQFWLGSLVGQLDRVPAPGSGSSRPRPVARLGPAVSAPRSRLGLRRESGCVAAGEFGGGNRRSAD